MEAASTSSAPLPPDPAPAVRQSLQPLLNSIAEIISQQGPPGGAATEVSVLPTGLIARGLTAWTHLIGAISFELFGHRHNVVGDGTADKKAFFDYEMEITSP